MAVVAGNFRAFQALRAGKPAVRGLPACGCGGCRSVRAAPFAQTGQQPPVVEVMAGGVVALTDEV